MKKIAVILVITITFLVFLSTPAVLRAASCDESGENDAPGTAYKIGFKNGLVPCGKKQKNLWQGKIFCFNPTPNLPNPYSKVIGVTIIAENLDDAEEKLGQEANKLGCTLPSRGAFQRNPMGGGFACRCELYHVFILILNVYNFIALYLALPLAGFLITIGGLLMLLSGIYPKFYDTGKRMLIGAGWGLLLIFGAWLIVDIVLKVLGINIPWNIFPIP